MSLRQSKSTNSQDPSDQEGQLLRDGGEGEREAGEEGSLFLLLVVVGEVLGSGERGCEKGHTHTHPYNITDTIRLCTTPTTHTYIHRNIHAPASRPRGASPATRRRSRQPAQLPSAAARDASGVSMWVGVFWCMISEGGGGKRAGKGAAATPQKTLNNHPSNEPPHPHKNEIHSHLQALSALSQNPHSPNH